MSSSSNLSILTPTGFQPFKGIKRYTHDECVQITTSKGLARKSALKHRYIVDGQVKFAKDLAIGDMIGCHQVVDIKFLNETHAMYDPINVGVDSLYCHDNGAISHNSFIGTGSTLIDAGTLLMLKASEPLKTIYDNALRIYERPVPGHVYIATVDVSQGRGRDDSAFNIFDVTARPFKQVVAYSSNTISPLILPDVIVKVCTQYNEALVLIENNGPGQVVCNSVYYDYEYGNTYIESSIKVGGIGVTQTKRTKRIGVSTLKDLVEEEKLHLQDAKTIMELSYFEERGASYEARDGKLDDLVMSLVMFAWFLSTTQYENYDATDIQQLLFAGRLKEMEDELMDFGFETNLISDALPEEYTQLRDEMEEWSKI